MKPLIKYLLTQATPVGIRPSLCPTGSAVVTEGSALRSGRLTSSFLDPESCRPIGGLYWRTRVPGSGRAGTPDRRNHEDAARWFRSTNPSQVALPASR